MKQRIKKWRHGIFEVHLFDSRRRDSKGRWIFHYMFLYGGRELEFLKGSVTSTVPLAAIDNGKALDLPLQFPVSGSWAGTAESQQCLNSSLKLDGNGGKETLVCLGGNEAVH